MVKYYIELMRPHQYVKNLFVVAPAFFSGVINQNEIFLDCVLAFSAFSITASAVYILNDIMDLEEDRVHPEKCNRPIANGRILVHSAWRFLVLLLFVSLAISYFLPLEFLYILFAYFVLNIFYSKLLKHISILDVSVISLGFVLRVLAGSSVLGTFPSMWIVLMTYLLAMFLALAKRRDDVLLLSRGLRARKNVDGYNLEFVSSTMVVMASVIIVAYIFYTISDSVQFRLGTEYLYFTVIFVITGMLRYMQIVFVENDSRSPSKIILKDRFLQINIVFWLFTFGFIIYGN